MCHELLVHPSSKLSHGPNRMAQDRQTASPRSSDVLTNGCVRRPCDRIASCLMTLRNINWVRDELILVCSLVVQNEWNGVRQTDPRAVELSDLLRRMPLHDPALRDETFRSPSSVQRKSYDIAT